MFTTVLSRSLRLLYPRFSLLSTQLANLLATLLTVPCPRSSTAESATFSTFSPHSRNYLLTNLRFSFAFYFPTFSEIVKPEVDTINIIRPCQNVGFRPGNPWITRAIARLFLWITNPHRPCQDRHLPKGDTPCLNTNSTSIPYRTASTSLRMPPLAQG